MLAIVQMERRGQSQCISSADGIRSPDIDLVLGDPWALEKTGCIIGKPLARPSAGLMRACRSIAMRKVALCAIAA
jgi:hypothetical protein